MGLARTIIPKFKKASTSRLPPAKLPIFRSVVSHPPPPYLTGEKVSIFISITLALKGTSSANIGLSQRGIS